MSDDTTPGLEEPMAERLQSQPDNATPRSRAWVDRLERQANDLAREFDAIATKAGIDLPITVISPLVSLFCEAMALGVYHSPTPPDINVRLNHVTRFEVIDETGRVYTRGHHEPREGYPPVAVGLSFQDSDRTLKVFLGPRAFDVAQSGEVAPEELPANQQPTPVGGRLPPPPDQTCGVLPSPNAGPLKAGVIRRRARLVETTS